MQWIQELTEMGATGGLGACPGVQGAEPPLEGLGGQSPPEAEA